MFNSLDFVQFSLTPLAIAILAAIACALPGNFLLLRRQALLGDAISHAILPGIVVAFLITGTIGTIATLLGATGAALVAVVLIELIRRLGNIEAGAAMAVVFTTMFAGGVLLLEQSDASSVHLDVEHALMGNLESLIWLRAEGWHSLTDLSALAHLPPELTRMTIICAIIIGLTIVFWRWLAISTFDEDYARTLGLPIRIIGFGLATTAATAAVAAFNAVGSILVIAMFICPPAAARLVTQNLAHQVLWSALFAALAATLGYIAAGYGPIWLGYTHSVSAAGMIAVASGLILVIAALLGPHRQQDTAPKAP